jgi:hypothetical protein
MFETKTVFISSKSRKAGESANSYTVNLETPIKGIVKAELLYASIPIGSLKTNGSNVIQINSNVYSIPEGTYDGSSLATVITQAVYTSTGVSCEYLTSEEKFMLYSTTDFTSNAAILGIVNLDANIYTKVTSTSGGKTYYNLYSDNSYYAGKYFVKSNVVLNTSLDFVCLDIEELRNQTLWSRPGYLSNNTPTFGNAMQCFAVVPVEKHKKNSDFDFCVEYPNQIAKLDRMTIRITDINNNVLNNIDDNAFMIKFYTSKQNVRNLGGPMF